MCALHPDFGSTCAVSFRMISNLSNLLSNLFILLRSEKMALLIAMLIFIVFTLKILQKRKYNLVIAVVKASMKLDGSCKE